MNENLKIILITGSYPPMRCGVGDYTYQLSKAIRKRQIDIKIYSSLSARLHERHTFLRPVVRKWGLLAMLYLVRAIKKAAPDIVHIQYPTLGYGYHLGPQFLLLLLRLSGIKVVTTVHEFKFARVPRRISLLPFLFWSNALIFTSEEERSVVFKALPRVEKKMRDATYVIPVGSNIPVFDQKTVKRDNGPVVSFFGLFYPGRRIELVVESFREAHKFHPELKFRFIGDLHPRYKEYFLKIKKLAAEMLPEDRVEWLLGLTPEEISVAIAESSACVLPFPNGASFRRTTFIAALSLGVPAITTRGTSTPDDLVDGKNVLFAEDKRTIASKIDLILSDKLLADKLSVNAKILSTIFLWDRIAGQHLSVYEKAYRAIGA